MFILLRCKIRHLGFTFVGGNPVYIRMLLYRENCMIQHIQCFVHAQLAAFNLFWCSTVGIISRSNVVWRLESKWMLLISNPRPIVLSSLIHLVYLFFFLKIKLFYAAIKYEKRCKNAVLQGFACLSSICWWSRAVFPHCRHLFRDPRFPMMGLQLLREAHKSISVPLLPFLRVIVKTNLLLFTESPVIYDDMQGREIPTRSEDWQREGSDWVGPFSVLFDARRRCTFGTKSLLFFQSSVGTIVYCTPVSLDIFTL